MTNRVRYSAALLLLTLFMSVHSQTGENNSAPLATPSPEASASPVIPPTASAPIPVADLVTQAESLNSDLASIEHQLVNDPEIAIIETQLPIISQKIESESARTQQLLSSAVSIENLNRLVDLWNRLGDTLPRWQTVLSSRASELETQMAALDRRQDTWTASLQAAQQGDVPPGITSRVEGAITAIQTTSERLDARRKQVLTLQEQVASQTTLVNGTLASIKAKRDETLSRIFVQDSSPLWSRSAYAGGFTRLVNETGVFYSAEWQLLKNYWSEHRFNFVLQILFLILLLWPLRIARRRIQQWHAEEQVGS